MLQDAGISSSSSCLSNNIDEEVELENIAMFKDLKAHSTWGGFFHIFGDDTEHKWKSSGSLEVGEKFAEGSQAESFHAHVTWRKPHMNEWNVKFGTQWVLKVFKKGTRLRHLQSQWPQGYLQWRIENSRCTQRGLPLENRWHCEVMYGTLLEDGRFAFMMAKEDEDLQSLIDRNMVKCVHHRYGPFSKEEEEDIIYRIASGINWLHNNNIVHRDLKASNVLVRKRHKRALWCFVADYECSIGVVGTGFFRAPEILQACKEKNVNARLELFSRAADIFSYEVLTGKLPFENHSLNGNTLIDHIINHNLRPEVSKCVDGWKAELLQSCWQSNVENRPTIETILYIFERSSKSKFIIKGATKRWEESEAQMRAE